MSSKEKSVVTRYVDEAQKQNRTFLLEPEAKSICKEYGVSVPDFQVASNAAEGVKAANKMGYPVVMKIVSPDIIHKSDVGGVVVDIKNDKEASEAYSKIVESVKRHKSDARITGILVEKMSPNAVEAIVGAFKDPQFGPTLMFGLGGVLVELLKDVTFRIAPITANDAREMISELKAHSLLEGYRGQPKADIDAIVQVLLNVSRLVMENPQIKELDLNPVRVYSKGAQALDARIILEKS